MPILPPWSGGALVLSGAYLKANHRVCMKTARKQSTLHRRNAQRNQVQLALVAQYIVFVNKNFPLYCVSAISFYVLCPIIDRPSFLTHFASHPSIDKIAGVCGFLAAFTLTKFSRKPLRNASHYLAEWKVGHLDMVVDLEKTLRLRCRIAWYSMITDSFGSTMSR